MSILLLGDIHGDYRVLEQVVMSANNQSTEENPITAIVQLGDFGLFNGHGMNNEVYFKNAVAMSKIPVYFIEGNHDDCTRWTSYTEVTQVYPDIPLYYIPRGTVMEIDGRMIAFMGGAASIDKQWRLQDKMHWDERELLSNEEYARLRDNADGKVIDMFITHCPPDSVIKEHFDNRAKLQFGVGLDWEDPTQKQIEELWHALGTPQVYSGHMHRSVSGNAYTIIDINQFKLV
jgi:predicted phosphodiesterase